MEIKSAEQGSDAGNKFLIVEIGPNTQVYAEVAPALLKAGKVPIDEGGASYEIETESGPSFVDNLTDHPQLVELVRRFSAGLLEDGPVEIPTRDESLAAKWDIDIASGEMKKLE